MEARRRRIEVETTFEQKFSQLHRVHPQWSWGAKSRLNFELAASSASMAGG